MNKAITFPNSTTLISLYLNQDSMHSYVCRKDVREKNCRVPWYFVFLVPRGAWKHVPHNCSLLEIEKKWKKMPNNTYPSQDCASLPICNVSSEPFADKAKIVLILKQGVFEAHLPRVCTLESKFNLKQYIDDCCVHHMIDYLSLLYTHIKQCKHLCCGTDSSHIFTNSMYFKKLYDNI